MDLRIVKTKKAIINAFLALRAKRPLEKITVKELCEMAMVNKSTFYSHYGDIYELSDSLENEVVLSVIQSMDHSEYIWENTGEFTRQLVLGYLSQDHLIQILLQSKQPVCVKNRAVHQEDDRRKIPSISPGPCAEHGADLHHLRRILCLHGKPELRPGPDTVNPC